jgi:hypothetical protein
MPINNDGSLPGVDSRSSSPSNSTARNYRPSVVNQLNESPMIDQLADITPGWDGFSGPISSEGQND